MSTFGRTNILIAAHFPSMDTWHRRVSLGGPEEMLAFWRTHGTYAPIRERYDAALTTTSASAVTSVSARQSESKRRRPH